MLDVETFLKNYFKNYIELNTETITESFDESTFRLCETALRSTKCCLKC